MKKNIITIAALTFAVASVCLAQSIDRSPKPGETLPSTLPEIRAELTRTQAQLQQALSRIARLEQQVLALQQTTSNLQQEQKNFGQPRLVPLDHK